jgi:catechol 2,3-dioxygenase-like lactoylglutathione lyase family enzyme
MLFDHVDLRVSDFAKTRPLYDALLPAMGYSKVTETADWINYEKPGDDGTGEFFGIMLDPDHQPNGSRTALRAANRVEVDRLAAIAQSAGATGFEPAHLCEEYTPYYYATFFEDADGNRLEICYRSPKDDG